MVVAAAMAVAVVVAVVAATTKNDIDIRLQQAAASIRDCYTVLAEQQSNVVWELIRDQSELVQWNHYPKHDVKDKAHCSQYFYHSHPSGDGDRVIEHGHFHLFFRPGALPDTAKPIVASDDYIQSQGEKDNLCHIVAIAMNEHGLPSALFTVNHWVTLGAWYQADIISNHLSKFCIDIANSRYALTNRWITQMVILFEEVIQQLLIARDQVIAEHQHSYPQHNVFYDKSLEVTSLYSLT